MRHILFFILMTLASGAWAQPPQGGPHHKRFNPEEFKKKLEATINEAAGFSDDESAKFFSLFHEMKEKQRKLNQEARTLQKQVSKCDNDDEAKKTITRIEAINVENAQLEQEYYNRICQSVPATKVLKAMRAEDKFSRDMLKRITERRKEKQRRP